MYGGIQLDNIRNWIFQMRKTLVITKWTGIRNVVVSLKAPFDDVVTMLQVLTRLAWNWNCPESKLIAWKENTYFSLQAKATILHLSWFSRVKIALNLYQGWSEKNLSEMKVERMTTIVKCY